MVMSTPPAEDRVTTSLLDVPRGRAAAILLLLALPGCATLRAPMRPVVAEPLPIVAGVCPGPFDDYGGEGRHLLKAVRERGLFREVVMMPPTGGRADVALIPYIGAPRPRTAIGAATVLPWAASATFLPWIVQADDPVRITVLFTRDGAADCRSHAGSTAGVHVGDLTVEDTTRRTTSMAGWTSLLLMLHPRWESGQVYEFRPAVDALVARREELAARMSAVPRRGG